MAVKKIDLTNLRKASPDVITARISNFNGQSVSEWLGAAHLANTGQLLQANGRPCRTLSAAKNRFSNTQIIDVLAASAPNHLIDSWSYLSRAITALAYQDHHATRHLAYYAQLRAAMSILACVGVGVFNGTNFSVSSQSEIRDIYSHDDLIDTTKSGKGTHAAVWESLSAWVKIPANAEYFFEAVSVFRTSILDCVNSLWPSAALNSLAGQLINVWGLDLSLGFTDHASRNISSYASHALNPLSTSFGDDSSFISNFWALLEPSGTVGFDTLDKYLLRSVLRQLHQYQKGNDNYATGPLNSKYEDLPPLVLPRLSKDFLLGNDGGETPLVLERALQNNNSDPLCLLGRAVLLLRAANGFVSKAFKEAGFNEDGSSLRPWLDPIGEKRGLFDAGESPELMSSLWEEVRYSLDDMETASTAANGSSKSWLQSLENGMPIVCQSERAGLWSLCP